MIRNDSRGRAAGGFTLLEIMIVLLIVAVLGGLAMPLVSSMVREAKLREPVEELQALAKEVRARAMTERYPYEIIFSVNGFQGRRYQLRKDEGSPTEEEGEDAAREEKEDESEEGEVWGESTGEETFAGDFEDERTRRERGERPTPSPTPTPAPLEKYELEREMTCRILYWGRTQWVDPPAESEVEKTPVQDRWIFQPSGICNPLRVRFDHGEAWVEVTFNPLTADLQSERSYLPE